MFSYFSFFVKLGHVQVCENCRPSPFWSLRFLAYTVTIMRHAQYQSRHYRQDCELLRRNRASVNQAKFFRTPCRKKYTLDRQMNDTFLTGTTSSITVQCLGKIVQRAPAVGAKMWCLFFTGRIAAQRQTAGIVLLTGQKSGFSPPRGDSFHRFRSNFAGPTGTWVRLAVQNFTSIYAEGWECGPKISENFPFW